MRLLLASRLFAALSDGKRDVLIKKYGLDEVRVMELSELDPTKNGAYTDWICREWKNERLPANVNDVLQKFDRLKQSPQFTGPKNIFDWTGPELAAQFERKWREQRKELSDKDLKARLKSEGLPGARMILNSAPWKIWRVSNPVYATILGSSTSWCTTQMDTAQSYCHQGLLYPIYKNDKPWAQGNVGEDGLEFRDTKNNNVELSDDTLDLLEKAKQIPQILVLLESALFHSDGAEISKEMASKVESLIIETDNHPLLYRFLKTYPWVEGWELAMDIGDSSAIADILENMKPVALARFLDSPILDEVVSEKGFEMPDNLLPVLLKRDRVEEYMQKASSINLQAVRQGGLPKELADKVRAYLKGKVAEVEVKSKDTKPLLNLMDQLERCEFGKADIKSIVLPLWQKQNAGARKPKRFKSPLHYNLLHIPEYAVAIGSTEEAKEMAQIPTLKGGETIAFHLRGDWAQYRVSGSYLVCYRCSIGAVTNRWIFDKLHLNPRQFCTQAYGYPSQDGIWPPSREWDMAALTRCVRALRRLCAYVEITDSSGQMRRY